MGENFIRTYEGQVDPSICAAIIKIFESEKSAQHEGHTRSGPSRTLSPLKQTTDSFILSKDARYSEYSELLVHAFQNCFNCYANEFAHAFITSYGDIQRNTGFKIGKYQQDKDQYSPHVDSWGTESNRTLAMLLYLNDVTEGGTTYFPYHDLRIQAQVGTVAVFPATFPWLHQGEIPTSNNKYIVNTFFIATKLPQVTRTHPAITSPRQYFEERLPADLQRQAQEMKHVAARIRFIISEQNGGTWLLHTQQGEAEILEQDSDVVDVTIRMRADDFVNMANGELQPEQAFFTGQLKFEGKVGIVLRLAYLFPHI